MKKKHFALGVVGVLLGIFTFTVGYHIGEYVTRSRESVKYEWIGPSADDDNNCRIVAENAFCMPELSANIRYIKDYVSGGGNVLFTIAVTESYASLEELFAILNFESEEARAAAIDSLSESESFAMTDPGGNFAEGLAVNGDLLPLQVPTITYPLGRQSTRPTIMRRWYVYQYRDGKYALAVNCFYTDVLVPESYIQSYD